jgi:Kef-type K+ transport system membrane component KefB
MTLPAYLPDLPIQLPGAAAIALLVLVAIVLGEVAASRLRAPRLLGYVAAGIAFAALGEAVGLPQAPAFAFLATTAQVAAALILFDLGQRVSFAWVPRNPWLAVTSAVECGLSFVLVFIALRGFDVAALTAALVAATAMATSPAIVLAVAREVRAQGQVTERALLLTALNCAAAVLLTTLLLAWAHLARRGGLDEFVLQPLYLVFGSLAVAALAARLLLAVARLIGRERYAQWLAVVASVTLVVAVADVLKLSSLLALLALGAFVRGFDRSRRLAAVDLGPLSAAAILLLITLSAVAQSFPATAFAWGPAVVLIVVRTFAKTATATALARVSGIGVRKGLMVGLSLTPMAAFAVLLAAQVAAVDARLAQEVQAIVMPAALVMSILGTLMLVWALKASGEAHEPLAATRGPQP